MARYYTPKAITCQDCGRARPWGEAWRLRCERCNRAHKAEKEAEKRVRRYCVKCDEELPANAHKYCDLCWKPTYRARRAAA